MVKRRFQSLFGGLWKESNHDDVQVGTRNETSRDDWVRSQIASIPAGSRLLDAGAGEQRYRPNCSHLKYVAQDFCQYDGLGNAEGFQAGEWDTSRTDIVGDITAIPAPDSSFDAILCTEVLEHVPDPVKAVEELCRLLRPGGILLVTAPFCSLTHFAPYHYSSGLNRFWYQHHFSRLGLDIQDLQPNGSFFDYLAQELRRVEYCAERFSRETILPNERAAINEVLRSLQRLTRTDEGSSELLAFGFHVRASKRDVISL